MFLMAKLRRGNGEQLGSVRVRNLSRTGLMADCVTALKHGDRLVVALRGIGDVAGKVNWVRGAAIGMAFDKPIDPKLARKPVGTGASAQSSPYLWQLNHPD